MHIVHKLFPNKFPIKKKNLRRNLHISYEFFTRKIREGLVDHPYILAINLAIRRNIFFSFKQCCKIPLRLLRWSNTWYILHNRSSNLTKQSVEHNK